MALSAQATTTGSTIQCATIKGVLQHQTPAQYPLNKHRTAHMFSQPTHPPLSHATTSRPSEEEYTTSARTEGAVKGGYADYAGWCTAANTRVTHRVSRWCGYVLLMTLRGRKKTAGTAAFAVPSDTTCHSKVPTQTTSTCWECEERCIVRFPSFPRARAFDRYTVWGAVLPRIGSHWSVTPFLRSAGSLLTEESNNSLYILFKVRSRACCD